MKIENKELRHAIINHIIALKLSIDTFEELVKNDSELIKELEELKDKLNNFFK